MKQAKVVFVSTPTIGNLVPVVEFSKVLSQQNQNLSATVLLINIPQRPLVQTYIDSLTGVTGKVEFLSLPTADPPSPDQYRATISFLSLLIENHTPHVRRALTKLKSEVPVAGFFVDMFCTSFIDVAEELNIPCYLYFASPASFLSFMLHLPTLDARVSNEFGDSAQEFVIPGFENPVPVESFPTFMLKRNGDSYLPFVQHAKRYGETRGMVVNTFKELESYCLGSMFGGDNVGPVYPIGPVVDREGPARWHPDSWDHEMVMKWLDDQPPSSVVFLTSGSMGSLNPAQVREIATGLDRTGHRFLWSIREPPKSKLELPNDYTNLEEVLPPGFSDRTKGKGLVCGWVPQVTILAHKAIGGFVSHCGWNSILESLYHGVPIGTWPIYAEQHLNAFQMVKELGLAVEITLDYRDGLTLVSAEDVERGVRKLMDGDDEVRAKVKEYSEMCKSVWTKNGSSSVYLGELIEDLMSNV